MFILRTSQRAAIDVQNGLSYSLSGRLSSSTWPLLRTRDPSAVVSTSVVGSEKQAAKLALASGELGNLGHTS